MELLQKSIHSLIAFKKAFDDSINYSYSADLSNFDKLYHDLHEFEDWLENSTAHYGDLSELKMYQQHFHYFVFKYAEYITQQKINESEMLRLALDKSYTKLLHALEMIKVAESA